MITMCSYLAVPIYMLVIPSAKFSDRTLCWFKKIGVCYVLFFVAAYLFKPVYQRVSGALTLGYSNSNTAGMYMYLTAIFLLLAFQNCSNKNEKLFSYGIVGIIDFLIVRTQCRTAFLLTSLCLICAFFLIYYILKRGLLLSALFLHWSFIICILIYIRYLGIWTLQY